MTKGIIKVAELNGVYVIKMEGDVRLTLCLSFDEFIERMFKQNNFCSVVFDLTQAEAIDSTTLGLMAKISIKERALGFDEPIVISCNPSITRLLVTMGFEDIFQLVGRTDYDALRAKPARTEVIEEITDDEPNITRKVLEAHRLLMDLNDDNKSTFKELVTSLEGQL